MDWTDNMDYMQLRPWTPLFQYPHDDAAGIVFTRADYECFLPEAPLNRTAVDFGLRFMVANANHSPTDFSNIVRDVHAFPSDWFTMLSASNERGKLKADSEKTVAKRDKEIEHWKRACEAYRAKAKSSAQSANALKRSRDVAISW